MTPTDQQPTPEQIAAFADGQLEGAELERIAAAIAADPALEKQVAAHRALAQRLGAHFAPIAAEPVPDHLAALLKAPQDNVASLADARDRRKGPPRWTWLAGPALAASLVLALTLRPASDAGYADAQLASALDSQLVAGQQADAPVRVLLSFRDAGGAYCRAFERAASAAIACRDAQGWQLRNHSAASSGGAPAGEYRQAGSAGDVLAAAQAMAAGPALTAEEELAARRNGWRETP
ncbi:anti-sigma factor [Novosphingobium sp. ES2-1]|uniref:anti-sigma factor n=1 Tax=Novosphingobium sp. ES2-1 TaxID=2780074 RepID=UPI00187F7CCB|nr:anti-sigma factor [Novosphingobium sp. ES2-1]QOV95748.1 anti-sigma factor [Novosphingobium sp. ES2-1]